MAQERPPQSLQIVRKSLKKGGDAAYKAIEEDAARICADLKSDRQQTLRETRRVLKPHGVLFAAAISRFASLIDGLSSVFFRDVEFRKIVAADLASGQHRNPMNHPAYFTTAYFHRPEDLAAEVHDPDSWSRRSCMECGSVP